MQQVYSLKEDRRPPLRQAEEIGGNVHARRLRRGFTLQSLADRSGVSRAMISEIERGSKNPTVRLAVQLAAGLGCTVSELLGEQDPPDVAPLVLRRNKRRVLMETGSGIERHVLSSALEGRGIQVVKYVIPAHQATGVLPPQSTGTWAHVTVLQGSLDCSLGTAERELRLESGDSVEFRADVRYGFRNPGRRGCQFFLIIDSRARPPLYPSPT